MIFGKVSKKVKPCIIIFNWDILVVMLSIILEAKINKFTIGGRNVTHVIQQEFKMADNLKPGNLNKNFNIFHDT